MAESGLKWTIIDGERRSKSGYAGRRAPAWHVLLPPGRQGAAQAAGRIPALCQRVTGEKAVCDQSRPPHSPNIPDAGVARKRKVFRSLSRTSASLAGRVVHRPGSAKGTNLLGVKTVIAQSYERIHRSNLVMMGVLPLQFKDGESAKSLGLDGKESISVDIDETVSPRDTVKVHAKKENGEVVDFEAIVRFDSLVELDYYRHGGILQMVLRNKLAQ